MKQTTVSKIATLTHMGFTPWEITQLERDSKFLNTIWTRQCNESDYFTAKIQTRKDNLKRTINLIISACDERNRISNKYSIKNIISPIQIEHCGNYFMLRASNSWNTAPYEICLPLEG